MKNFDGFSIKVKHYKCFGDPEQGFDDIKPINLIIGRNNSGKSTLLELIDYATKGGIDVGESQWNDNKPPLIIAEAPLTEEELRVVFREGHCTNILPGKDDWEFGKRLVGARLRWSVGVNKSNTFISIGNSLDGSRPLDNFQYSGKYSQDVAIYKNSTFIGKKFHRIFAERNIVPEKHADNIEVDGHGKGVTNIIQNFLNQASRKSSLVEEILLNELNAIFEPDATFSNIVCQLLDDDLWEIYL